MNDPGALQRKIDDIRARNPMPALVGRRVKLTRSGRDWVACCPFHGEKTPSFYVFQDHYHCFGCGAHGDAIDFVMKSQGASFADAIASLSGGRVLPDAESTQPAQPKTAAHDRAERERKSARAAAIYAEAEPGGAMVRNYLESRGCGAFIPEVLRFHPACPRPAGESVERLPAMIAPITDPATNVLVGCHCTFLRPDGFGKIAHGQAKIMRGSWGVIRLADDDDVTSALGICEGIETGLAIMQRAGWRAIWAAGCAGAIARFPVLPGVECLTLFPDADDSGAGSNAAETCAARWTAAAREVQTIWPPAGTDWLDALAQKAAA